MNSTLFFLTEELTAPSSPASLTEVQTVLINLKVGSLRTSQDVLPASSRGRVRRQAEAVSGAAVTLLLLFSLPGKTP